MRFLTVLLLALTGLAMAIPGGYLASLGGSLYYVVAGVLFLVSSGLIWRRRPAGLYLFWLVYLATLAWSVWEVGFDAWALMPRVIFLTVAALWIALASLTRMVGPLSSPLRFFAFLLPLLGVALVALSPFSRSIPAASPMLAGTPAQPGAGDWSHYGNSLGGTRYSALAQITPANVGNLEQAWVYHTAARTQNGRGRGGGGLEVTPLMVDGTLYGCTANDAVFALDPVSGQRLAA